mmetsp:Transcript_8810/g.12128  ORF Transcript_8810/g.12128 Transcript_8810/m.12128 type:complete len:151 (+) Transcript_8810:137-589(+)
MLKRERPGGLVHSLFVLIALPLFLGVRPPMPVTSRIPTTSTLPKEGIITRNSSLDDLRPLDRSYSAGALVAWTAYFFMYKSNDYCMLSNHKQEEATIMDYNIPFSSYTERCVNTGSKIIQDPFPPLNGIWSCENPSGTKNSAHFELPQHL